MVAANALQPSKGSDHYRSRVVALLYVTGKQLRQNRQLYDGYKFLISKMFQSFNRKQTTQDLFVETSRDFEYLQQRYEHLVLDTINEADKEMKRLINIVCAASIGLQNRR